MIRTWLRTTRRARSRLASTLAIALALLSAACGGSGPPGPEVDEATLGARMLLRGAPVVIAPEQPFPTEGFGQAVAVADASVAVADFLDSDHAIVRTYWIDRGQAVPTGAIRPADPTERCFGASLAFQSGQLAVGSPCAFAGRGEVRVHSPDAGFWLEDAALGEQVGATARFGAALAAGQGRLVVGAPGEGASSGAAYVYALGASGWTLERRLAPADLGPDPLAPSGRVSLFRLGRRPLELRDHLLEQDLIYVGGGSMVNLLAVWEAHDIASILSLAWRQGIVLAGQSAGAMCWFEAGITQSSGRPLAAAGLGLLGGSLCVHYNNEPERRAAYLDAVGEGMPSGYGLDDYAGLLWEGEGTPSAVTARRGARAYRVSRREGEVAESPLPARFLPAPAPAALREDIAEFRRIKTMRRRAGWLG
jgi:hypothetical protein